VPFRSLWEWFISDDNRSDARDGESANQIEGYDDYTAHLRTGIFSQERMIGKSADSSFKEGVNEV
jgi:hypothetical protein